MERKLATVLFVDLVGSTEQVASADPEVVRRRVTRFFDQVSSCIETHGGTVEKFAGDAVMTPGQPFHIHFSDIQYANRNETKHLPYGDGTLRAEPLRDALARFDRPATVISESPDAASTDAIKLILGA